MAHTTVRLTPERLSQCVRESTSFGRWLCLGAFVCSRRIRILALIEDYSRAYLRLVADISIPGERVGRELDAAVFERVVYPQDGRCHHAQQYASKRSKALLRNGRDFGLSPIGDSHGFGARCSDRDFGVAERRSRVRSDAAALPYPLFEVANRQRRGASYLQDARTGHSVHSQIQSLRFRFRPPHQSCRGGKGSRRNYRA